VLTERQAEIAYWADYIDLTLRRRRELGMDSLNNPACCLDCYWKGRTGEMIASDTLRCPKCKSANWHPIGSVAVSVPKYIGEIGTKN
jgi:predicted Zn-ribbon and HTH transcriptional regulator